MIFVQVLRRTWNNDIRWESLIILFLNPAIEAIQGMSWGSISLPDGLLSYGSRAHRHLQYERKNITMKCRMTRGIYLRANGDLPCYCSTGEQISLGRVPFDSEDYNFVNDLYFNDKMKYVRDSFEAGIIPFPKYCLKCNYLDPFHRYESDLLDTEIEWAHIEPGVACNLACPYCIHGAQSQNKLVRHFLPTEIYEKMVDDIANAGMTIKWMYFSGRGEPGLHRHLWDMVAYAKQRLDTNFLVNTNGNIPYQDAIITSGLDKIKIALDSLDQDVYATYRINGKVDRILKLTEQIARRKKELGVTNPEIIWQKVMFDFNDSQEELIEYQEKALALGVDKLRIFYTFTENLSKKTPAEFPAVFPNIEYHNPVDHALIDRDTVYRTLDDENTENRLGELIWLVSRLLSWYNLGGTNRYEFNDYANMELSNPELYRKKIDHPHCNEYRGVISDCFDRISKIYKSRSQEEASDFFSEQGRLIQKLKI